MGAVGQVGGLVYSHIELALDDAAYLFVDAGQDRDVLLSPGLMWDGRDFDGREEVLVEVTALLVAPSESEVLDAHKMVCEVTLRW